MLKLIKHEFIATYRNFFTIYLGVLALSILGGFSRVIAYDEYIVTIVAVALASFMIGGFVILVIQSIKMYTSDLYASRGYLNLTLPVETWRLLFSKIIVMVIWYIITFVIFTFAYLLFTIILALASSYKLTLKDIYDAITSLFDSFKLPFHVYVLWIFNSLATLFRTITFVGLAATLVSTGWARKGRWAIAVVFYFIFDFIVSNIHTLFVKLFALGDYSDIFLPSIRNTFSILGLSTLSGDFTNRALLSIGVNLVFGVIAFFVTSWLIDNKIEIE